MERRDFLKTSGLIIAGATLTPGLIMCQSHDTDKRNKAMLNLFGVTENDLKKVIAAALEKGGDYADLFFENTFSNSLTLRDGSVNRTSADIDYGAGIRVLSGERTGYAYTENVSTDEMLKAARTAATIASLGPKIPSLKIEEKKYDNFYPVDTKWEDISINQKSPLIQQLNKKIFELDSRVIKATINLYDSSSYIMFFDSDGRLCSDYRPMYALSAVCVMESDGKIENAYAAKSFRKSIETITDDMIDAIAKKAVDEASLMFEAVRPKGGEMPVVMGAGGSGILLHEAIGHAFEADFNRKNISIFSDKLGEQICETNINVVDDGTMPGFRGSINFDDEGNPSQKTYIVKDGVLASYLHDKISAEYYKVPTTGNGRRESFRYAPIPRMRLTYMEAGNVSQEDIIASVKNGVFVENFSNGQVQIGEGDFTFFVKSGRLIENGKLTAPIKDINIIGNGPKALADVSMVADNLIIDDSTWTCGKDGQGVPVSQGMPSLLVKKLTVGGTA